MTQRPSFGPWRFVADRPGFTPHKADLFGRIEDAEKFVVAYSRTKGWRTKVLRRQVTADRITFDVYVGIVWKKDEDALRDDPGGRS